jgi:hypothetical protein
MGRWWLVSSMATSTLAVYVNTLRSSVSRLESRKTPIWTFAARADLCSCPQVDGSADGVGRSAGWGWCSVRPRRGWLMAPRFIGAFGSFEDGTAALTAVAEMAWPEPCRTNWGLHIGRC